LLSVPFEIVPGIRMLERWYLDVLRGDYQCFAEAFLTASFLLHAPEEDKSLWKVSCISNPYSCGTLERPEEVSLLRRP